MGEKVRDYGTVSRLMFAESTGTAEANVWNRNPLPRGSDYGVATIGIIMFSTFDSTMAFFSITLKQLEPAVTKIIRASLQRGECHALKYHVTQSLKEQTFSKSNMYSFPSHLQVTIYLLSPPSLVVSHPISKSSSIYLVLPS
jgi:hypothetical protein